MTTAILASPPVSKATREEQNRQRSKGGKFFVLERAAWELLWTLPTVNRLNLLTAYLVLLAGTGGDHALSKWSAHACEHYAGMGKPRAQVAIRELIDTGMIARVAGSSAAHPQYRFPQRARGEDDIFLPMQIITGVEGGSCGETPVLRRVRETGDAAMLRLLVDLYGRVQLDRTHGIPIASLCLLDPLPRSSHRLARRGANALWALRLGRSLHAADNWREIYGQAAAEHGSDDPFETRLQALKSMGALFFEPWIFNGIGFDAEPLLPAPLMQDAREPWQQAMLPCARALHGGDTDLFDAPDVALMVLPAHHRMPRLFSVARLRVEADTPGRRSSWLQRNEALEGSFRTYRALEARLQAEDFGWPMRLS